MDYHGPSSVVSFRFVLISMADPSEVRYIFIDKIHILKQHRDDVLAAAPGTSRSEESKRGSRPINDNGILVFFKLFYLSIFHSILFRSVLLFSVLFYSILLCSNSILFLFYFYSSLFYSISILFHSIPFHSILFYSIYLSLNVFPFSTSCLIHRWFPPLNFQ